MSGGPTAGDISEAEMMGLIAWSRGVNPSRIVLEDKSRNTEQNAEFTANIVRSKNVGKKFIITDQSRLERAIRIFQNYFMEFKNVRGVDCNVPVGLVIKQMEEYLKVKDNRIVRRRLDYLKRTAGGAIYNPADKMQDYAKIISNTSGIQDKEFPLRSSISDKEIKNLKFLTPQELNNAPKTAIFVLPNRPLDEVTPSIDSVYRALKAVELYKKFPDSVIIMLGPKTVGDIPEGQMMALVAWSRGVDTSKIVLETNVRSIEDKAEFIAGNTASTRILPRIHRSKKRASSSDNPVFPDPLQGRIQKYRGN